MSINMKFNELSINDEFLIGFSDDISNPLRNYPKTIWVKINELMGIDTNGITIQFNEYDIDVFKLQDLINANIVNNKVNTVDFSRIAIGDLFYTDLFITNSINDINHRLFLKVSDTAANDCSGTSKSFINSKYEFIIIELSNTDSVDNILDLSTLDLSTFDLVKVCAESIFNDFEVKVINGDERIITFINEDGFEEIYWPIDNNSQAMGLIRIFMLEVNAFAGFCRLGYIDNDAEDFVENSDYIKFNEDNINEAIVECVASYLIDNT